ncbi:hypothetical protein AK830_g1969 [Neonectria ditissima]|uniref:VOC domain-containing protein n=1 Tax=Neonectria ditissima TaxID=78410 RepID=A0A0P7BCS5_9HYPO|nr:hypothetical protein AK830_g1969 [Neonectria ditissima]
MGSTAPGLSGGKPSMALAWLAMIQIPALLWTGSITLILTEFNFSTTVQIPNYSESTSDFWARKCDPATSCDELLGKTSDLGIFTFVAWKTKAGLLLNSVEQASARDSSTPHYRKLDNTGFTYHGRSYGVASAVGLVESKRTDNTKQATLLNYTFLEDGYLSNVSCQYNRPSLIAFNASNVAETPVDLAAKNISVTLVDGDSYGQFDVDPDRNLTKVAFHGVGFLSQTLTTLYTSVLGDSFLRNINSVQSQKERTDSIDSDAITGIEEGLELLLDHFHGNSGSAQVMLLNETKSVDTEMTLEVVRFGKPQLAYAAFGTTIVIFAVAIYEPQPKCMAKDDGIKPYGVKDWAEDPDDDKVGLLRLQRRDAASLGYCSRALPPGGTLSHQLSKEALGQICWLEVPVLDVDRAKKFYTELFGWEFADEPRPGVGDCIKSMHFFSKGKTLHGAFMHVEAKYQVVNHVPGDPAPMPVLPTLCVVDCAESLEKAEALGGKTAIPKTEIGGGMGFFARLIDSEGNMIGTWSQK